ncbi:MAG: WD40/YVTN/BNR-like repeat-containing protein [Bdellovibrionales bacterium]
MKNSLKIVGLILAMTFGAQAFSPTWIAEVREIYNPPGAASSNTQGLAYSQAEKALYTSITTSFPNRKEWSIRKSLDFGNTWQTVHSVEVNVTIWSAGGRDIAFSPTGSIFAIGRTEDPDKRSRWLVLRGNQTPGSWEIVDNYTLFPAPGDHYAYHIAISRKGYVCVTGKVANNTDSTQVTERRWIVRCSKDDGETWQTIDDEPEGLSSSLAFDSKGNLYAAGVKYAANMPSVLQVKKLARGTSTWKVIDRFQYAGRHTGAINAFVDSKDRVYAMGSGWENQEAQLRRWLIRRSNDGGQTWKLVDRYTLQEGAYAEAYQMVEDHKGRLFTVGYAMDLEKRYHAIIRMSVNGGKTWSTVSDYMGPDNLGLYGHNLTSTPKRIFFSGGWYAQEGRKAILAELLQE